MHIRGWTFSAASSPVSRNRFSEEILGNIPITPRLRCTRSHHSTLVSSILLRSPRSPRSLGRFWEEEAFPHWNSHLLKRKLAPRWPLCFALILLTSIVCTEGHLGRLRGEIRQMSRTPDQKNWTVWLSRLRGKTRPTWRRLINSWTFNLIHSDVLDTCSIMKAFFLGFD